MFTSLDELNRLFLRLKEDIKERNIEGVNQFLAKFKPQIVENNKASLDSTLYAEYLESYDDVVRFADSLVKENKEGKDQDIMPILKLFENNPSPFSFSSLFSAIYERRYKSIEEHFQAGFRTRKHCGNLFSHLIRQRDLEGLKCIAQFEDALEPIVRPPNCDFIDETHHPLAREYPILTNSLLWLACIENTVDYFDFLIKKGVNLDVKLFVPERISGTEPTVMPLYECLVRRLLVWQFRFDPAYMDIGNMLRIGPKGEKIARILGAALKIHQLSPPKIEDELEEVELRQLIYHPDENFVKQYKLKTEAYSNMKAISRTLGQGTRDPNAPFWQHPPEILKNIVYFTQEKPVFDEKETTDIVLCHIDKPTP